MNYPIVLVPFVEWGVVGFNNRKLMKLAQIKAIFPVLYPNLLKLLYYGGNKDYRAIWYEIEVVQCFHANLFKPL